MGGDSFEGTQKLTNQQYQHLVPQILTLLSGLYVRAEPYIPLPEKEVHGDIDFLVILKSGVKAKDIVGTLKIEKFIINNNETVNSVYKNKQVDFCFVKNQEHFTMAKFYKSYSGIGAHLGIFLPSKQIKLSESGLYALAYKQHIKFEFLLTNSVPEILKFYGLDYERYEKGFKTRKQLFQYLRGCCFMNEKKLIDHDCKNQSKITKFFTEYMKDQTNIRYQQDKIFQDPLNDTLAYFKKRQQFQQQFHNLLQSIERKQNLNKKFNATHVMEKFDIKPKQVNKMKEKFRTSFPSNEEYYQYIEENQLQEILMRFGEILVSEKKEKEKNMEKIDNGNGNREVKKQE